MPIKCCYNGEKISGATVGEFDKQLVQVPQQWRHSAKHFCPSGIKKWLAWQRYCCLRLVTVMQLALEQRNKEQSLKKMKVIVFLDTFSI